MRVVRALLANGFLLTPPATWRRLWLLTPAPATQPRATTVPLLVSTSLHALVGAALLVISTLGLTNADERTDVIEPEAQPIRMVYLAIARSRRRRWRRRYPHAQATVEGAAARDRRR